MPVVGEYGFLCAFLGDVSAQASGTAPRSVQTGQRQAGQKLQCPSGGRRVALADDDEVSHAQDLSPGVLMRPPWQDACLPSIGFIVGPGELSYLAVVGSLYKTLGVPQPAFVPRASMTLVESSLVKLLNRFSWDIPDLMQGPEVLARNLETDGGSSVEEGLARLAERVSREIGDLREELEGSDQQMTGPMDRTRSRIVDEIERLSQKLRNSRQNRQGTGQRQIRRLCSNLRPRGRVQERVLTVLPFLVSHGSELADHLVDAADPFAVSHGVLEL